MPDNDGNCVIDSKETINYPDLRLEPGAVSALVVGFGSLPLPESHLLPRRWPTRIAPLRPQTVARGDGQHSPEPDLRLRLQHGGDPHRRWCSVPRLWRLVEPDARRRRYEHLELVRCDQQLKVATVSATGWPPFMKPQIVCDHKQKGTLTSGFLSIANR